MKRSIAFGKCMEMVILLLSARIRRLRTGWSSACKWQERTPNFAGQTDLPAVGKSNPGIELRQISTTGKSLLIFRNRVKPRNQKYFPSPPTQIRCISKPSRPDRGALRTSRNAGRDAVDAAASGEQQRAGRMMPKRTAKSCGSDAPMPASSLREDAQATVSNKPGHRGEREVSRKTIARGMPGLFRCDRGDYARVLCLISHARLRVHWAPGIPCALYFLGERFLQHSDASRRGNAESYLDLTSLRAKRSNP